MAATTTLVCLLLCPLLAHAQTANLVLLANAVQEGAVCLDGSPPGYYLKRGTDSGQNKWIVYLQGGGWCRDEQNCLDRSKTSLGSSKSWAKTFSLTGHGFLSGDETVNPEFYNWNVAYVNYCDGASFAGNVAQPVVVSGTSIHFRGFRILNATLTSLLAIGLKDATEVILTGCSAGGLATYIHADYVKSVLSPIVKYHALADAGYFIDGQNTQGQYFIQTVYEYVYKMQNCSIGVNQDCIRGQPTGEDWKCFMAQYTYPYIKSPIFSVNSQVDTWQLKGILQLQCTPPNCTAEQMAQFNKFYEEFKTAEAPILKSPVNGCFLDSCLAHCQIEGSWDTVSINGQTMRETFANWYFKKSTGTGKAVDCAYPCNKSCP